MYMHVMCICHLNYINLNYINYTFFNLSLIVYTHDDDLTNNIINDDKRMHACMYI